MPRKLRGKSSLFNFAHTSDHSTNGEVFRNFFAVVDDIDPHESLKHLKEMFKDKIDDDVITMIFSECGYSVDQALESLIALSNDNQFLAKPDNFPPSNGSVLHSSNNNNCVSVNELDNVSDNFSHLEISESLFTEINIQKFPEQQLKSLPNYSPESKVINNDASLYPPVEKSNKFQNFVQLEEKCSIVKDVQEIEQDVPITLQDTQEITQSETTSECKSKASSSSIFSNTSQPFISTTFTPMSSKTATSHDFMIPIIPLQKISKFSFQSPSANFIPQVKSNQPNFSPKKKEKSFSPKNKTNSKADNKNYENVPFEEKVNNILQNVSHGVCIMVILRGLPGSGKSFLANELKSSGEVFSTDDYFCNENGKYVFDWTKLSEAHEWNRKRTLQALKQKITPVIIDNTNTECWEMIPYIKLAINYKYNIHILEPNTSWKFKPKELAKKNRHKITKEKIKKIMDRYAPHKKVQELVESYKTTYIQDGKLRPSKFFSIKPNIEVKEASPPPSQNWVKPKNFLQAVNSFDSDSVTGETGNEDLDNLISLEAIVHQEDESDTSDMSFLEYRETSSENISNLELDVENSDLKIESLNDLKLLTQEDSEETSSNISQQMLSSNSSQDAAWEAITERDEDFSWSVNLDNLNPFQDSDFKNTKNQSCSENPAVLVDLVETESNKSIDAEQINGIDGVYNSNKSLFKNDTPPKLIKKNSNISFDKSCINDSFSNEPLPQRKSMAPYSCLIEANEKIKTETIDLGWNSVNNIELAENTWNDDENIDKIVENNALLKPQSLYPSSSISSTSSEITNKVKNQPKHTKKKIVKNGVSSNFGHEFSFCNKNLGTCDWELPAFPIIPSNNLSNSSNMEKSLILIDSASQTELGDFVLLNKIENNPLYISHYQVLKASLKSSELFNRFNNKAKVEHIVGIPRFDKSTSTECLDNSELIHKVEILKGCFPEINEQDLTHLLELCYGDNTWLSNILLEWGYKYNNPYPQDKKETDEKVNSSVITDWCKEQLKSENVCFSPSKEILNNSEEELNILSINNVHEENEYFSDDNENNVATTPIKSTAKNLVLKLNSSFASKLEEMFGPVMDSKTGPLSPSHRKVIFDFDTAKLIYDKWKESVQNRLLSEELNAAESTLKESSSSSSSCNSTSRPRSKSKLRENSSSPCRLPSEERAKSNEPVSLSEIMDMEYALQLHKEEKLKINIHNENDIALKLQRQELYNMYPGIDTIALDEMFEANDYSFEHTILALNADIGEPSETIRKYSVESTLPKPKAKPNIQNMFTSQNWNDWVQQDNDIKILRNSFPTLTSTISKDAESLRTEATKHYLHRQELMDKAKSCYIKGMPQVASYYAEEGRICGQKLKDANKRAVELILEERNSSLGPSVLDLHGLYVKEAIQSLGNFLKSKKNELSKTDCDLSQTVTVLTGRGVHSLNGPKLRLSVVKYLEKNGHKFDEINQGVFNINISSCP